MRHPDDEVRQRLAWIDMGWVAGVFVGMGAGLTVGGLLLVGLLLFALGWVFVAMVYREARR